MKDVEHTEDGDILLVDTGAGLDFRWKQDATNQHLRNIVQSRPFDYRLTPIGVGVEDFIEDETPDDLLHAIRTNVARDKCKPNFVGFKAGKLVVNGKY